MCKGFPMKVIKVRVLAAAALATIAALGGANAADMSMPPAYKAPAAPTYSWTGCYIGGGGGYGWWTHDSYVQDGGSPVTASQTDGGSGWFGQGQGGCDYQIIAPVFNVPAVIGLFGDYAGGDIDGRSAFPGVVGGERESGAWSVGARAGVLITPRILTFFDGGFTQAHFNAVSYNLAIAGGTFTGLSLASQNYNGWFLGSGFEYALDWSWLPVHGLFLKTEYRYSQFDTANVPITGTAGGGLVVPAGITLNSKPFTEMVSTELVWRFNWQ